MLRRLLFVGLCSLPLLSLAHAADQTIFGSTLLLTNPSGPALRRITVKAKKVPSFNTVVGDPAADGAIVTIDVDGASPSEQTFTMPASAWSGDASNGFKYQDPTGANGPVKRAQIKHKRGVFTLKVAIDGRLGTVDLVPPNPGTGGCVLFTIGGGDSYSVQFTTGQVTNQAGTRFKVAKPTSEGSCVPTTTTTTTSSTTTTTLTQLPDLVPPGAAPLRYRDLVFGAVTKTADVTYGSAVNGSSQTVTLRLDVYQPTGDIITERPAIVWVHGGSFASGDKTSAELVDEANTFAMKGYFNVSINYRLEPGGCTGSGTSCALAIQEAIQDAQSAVRFLRTNALIYGIDTTRIAIGGTSAGAITALNVGFDSSEDPTATVAAAVSFSGAWLLGAPIDAADAPSLLLHGTADPIVPYSLAVNTVNQAHAVGLDSFLTSWPGAGHVPYVQNRTQILNQTTNFLYWEMDLANAAQ